MLMKIQKATADDADRMGFILAKSWHQAYKGIVPEGYLKTVTPQTRAERFRKDIPQHPEREYNLIFADGQPVGVMILVPCRDEDLTDAGELAALYLLEEYWGKGLGQEAMDYAIHWFESASYKQAAIWCLAENQRALRFYEKNGFILDGTERFLELGEALLVVRCIRKFSEEI